MGYERFSVEIFSYPFLAVGAARAGAAGSLRWWWRPPNPVARYPWGRRQGFSPSISDRSFAGPRSPAIMRLSWAFGKKMSVILIHGSTWAGIWPDAFAAIKGDRRNVTGFRMGSNRKLTNAARYKRRLDRGS